MSYEGCSVNINIWNQSVLKKFAGSWEETCLFTCSVCSCVCVCVCALSPRGQSGEPEIVQLVLFPTVRNFLINQPIYVCVFMCVCQWAAGTSVCVCVCVCVFKYKDIRGLYEDSNISMCKPLGSNCLRVWLLKRVRDIDLQWRKHRREREGVSRQRRSSVHYKAAQWPRYLPLRVCVLSLLIFSVCPCLMSHTNFNYCVLHYIRETSTELQLPRHHTTLSYNMAVNVTATLLILYNKLKGAVHQKMTIQSVSPPCHADGQSGEA